MDVYYTLCLTHNMLCCGVLSSLLLCCVLFVASLNLYHTLCYVVFCSPRPSPVSVPRPLYWPVPINTQQTLLKNIAFYQHLTFFVLQKSKLNSTH